MKRQPNKSDLLLPRKVVAEKQRGGNAMVHKLISDVAQGICHEFYEIAAKQSNNFYKAWPDRNKFVSLCWQDFIGEAKATLSKQLGNPAIPIDQKEIIYDALCLDRSLPKSQSRGLH